VRIGEVRAVTRAVGRRTALRYLAIGAGLTLVAACGGNGTKADGVKGNGVKGNGVKADGVKADGVKADGVKGNGTKADGTKRSAAVPTGNPLPTPTAVGAVSAFLRGSWKVETVYADQRKLTGTATVGKDSWTIAWEGGPKPWHGSWAHQDERLSLKVPRSAADPTDLADAAALNLRSTVLDPETVGLPWLAPGTPVSDTPTDTSGATAGQNLDIVYAKGKLVIRHFDTHGKVTVHTCTRA
jgi:hypothetical protein